MSHIIWVLVLIIGTRKCQKKKKPPQNLLAFYSNAGDFFCSQGFAYFSNTVEYKHLEAPYLVAPFITKL